MKAYKKLIKLSFALVVVLFCITCIFSNTTAIGESSSRSAGESSQNIFVEIDGRRANFPDQQPVVLNGRTMIPVRGVFEQLGFEVGWDNVKKTVSLSNGTYHTTITLGETTFETNNTIYPIDVPACTINNRAMLPFRAVLESVGCSVYWDEDRKTVFVYSDENGASRLSLVLLYGDMGYSYVCEIMSDGRINFCEGNSYWFMTTNPIPHSPNYNEIAQKDWDEGVQTYCLSSEKFSIIKEMIDALSRFDSDLPEGWGCDGCPSVHVLVDENQNMSYYGSSYSLEWAQVRYWDNVVIVDLAYFLIDTLPYDFDKSTWKTPKDLVELGELDNYNGLSTFYYRFGEEPKTHIVYTDHNKIDSVLEWLEE